jgi:hypothetical protein
MRLEYAHRVDLKKSYSQFSRKCHRVLKSLGDINPVETLESIFHIAPIGTLLVSHSGVDLAPAVR